MNPLQVYTLTIDGPLLRNRRCLLLKLRDAASRGKPYVPEADGDRDLLEGLVALLDEIADQAHDRYGLDCLLEEESDEGETKER
jgi:hypothetical protein